MNCAPLTYGYGSADQNENFSSLPAEFPFPFVRPDRPAPATRVTPPASSPESSEQTTSSVSPETSPSPPVIRMKNKRRGRSLTPSTSRDSEDSCESSGSRISRPPRKRLNHHDKRCLTIQVGPDQFAQLLRSDFFFFFEACPTCPFLADASYPDRRPIARQSRRRGTLGTVPTRSLRLGQDHQTVCP